MERALTLWPSDRLDYPLPAVLVYDPADPLAVKLAFLHNGRETVSYMFARDLLAEGLDQRCGDGDVTLEPHFEMPATWLVLTLIPESGYPFELYVARPVVESIVTAIYQLVPMGKERIGGAVDEAIARILAVS